MLTACVVDVIEYDYTPLLQDSIVEVLERVQDPLPADRILELVLPYTEEAADWYGVYPTTPRMELHNSWQWKRLDDRLSVLEGVLEKLASNSGNTAILECVQMDYGNGEEPCYSLKEERVMSALGHEEMQATGESGVEPAGDEPPKIEHVVGLNIPEREDKHNEFKETFSIPTQGGKSNDIRMEVVIAVAAFTNTDGGRLFIGVNDDGEPVGLRDLKHYKNTDKMESAIQDFVHNKLEGIVDIDFEFSGEDYLVIHVTKRKHNWVYINREFYVREGNRSRKMSAQETAEYQKEYQ